MQHIGLLPGWLVAGFQENRRHGIDVLTVGTGWYVVPDGVYRIKVTVVGGGGGSRSVTVSTSSSTAGGGGGGWAIDVRDVRPGQRIPYTVGAGGAGGTDAAASAGGTSTFGALSATGGSPGTGTTAGSALGGLGSGSSIGLVGRGGAGGPPSTVAYQGGWGGGSLFGAQTPTINTGTLDNGFGGYSIGVGGSGTCGNTTGRTGGNGIIIVEY